MFFEIMAINMAGKQHFVCNVSSFALDHGDLVPFSFSWLMFSQKNSSAFFLECRSVNIVSISLMYLSSLWLLDSSLLALSTVVVNRVCLIELRRQSIACEHRTERLC